MVGVRTAYLCTTNKDGQIDKIRDLRGDGGQFDVMHYLARTDEDESSYVLAQNGYRFTIEDVGKKFMKNRDVFFPLEDMEPCGAYYARTKQVLFFCT